MDIHWSKMTCTLMDTWCLLTKYVPPNSLSLSEFVCVCMFVCAYAFVCICMHTHTIFGRHLNFIIPFTLAVSAPMLGEKEVCDEIVIADDSDQ